MYHEYSQLECIFFINKKNINSSVLGHVLMLFLNKSPNKSTYYTVSIRHKLTESNPQLNPGFTYWVYSGLTPG